MRSTEEIYQDLKNKYDEYLASSNKKSRSKTGLSPRDYLGLICIIALWIFCIALIIMLHKIDKEHGLALSFRYSKSFLLLAIFATALYVAKTHLSHGMRKTSSELNENYKATVIKELVHEICPTLEYVRSANVFDTNYIKARFDYYDNYHAEDLIDGSVDGVEIELIDIVTEKIIRNDEGPDTHITSFEGLFSTVPSPIYSSFVVDIRSNKFVGTSSMNGKRVNMDSATFEKHFNVYSNEELYCMKVLTADVMDILLKFKEETDIPIDVIIKQDFVYIRYHIKDMFEVAGKFKEPISKAEIEKTIFVLSNICKLNVAINRVFQNKDIKQYEI